MSVQVKIGTTGWKACPSGVADEGYVLYSGEIPLEADGMTPAMAWDDALGNMRPRTEEENAQRQAEINAPAAQRAARSNVANAYSQLPVEVQVAFASVYVSIERFLDLGRWDVALALLQGTAVPSDLESVKQQFLAALTAAKP